MRPIFLYTGKGAYQAKDVENFLSGFDLDYSRICEHDLDKIVGKGIFIVPGGQIRSYLPSWKSSGIKKIKDFVRNGGCYIGLCAGSYVAGKSFAGTKGLNFVSVEFKHRNFQKTIRVKDENGKSFEMIAENSPDFSDLKEEHVLWSSAQDGQQLIEIPYGTGKVFLFASHPEGSIYYNKHPRTFSGTKRFLKFLKEI
jgi:hypothetical protein